MLVTAVLAAERLQIQAYAGQPQQRFGCVDEALAGLFHIIRGHSTLQAFSQLSRFKFQFLQFDIVGQQRSALYGVLASVQRHDDD